MQEEIRLGILCGSVLSAIWGAIVFQMEDYLVKHKIFQ
jgi:Na+/H+ antiporter NhaA